MQWGSGVAQVWRGRRLGVVARLLPVALATAVAIGAVETLTSLPAAAPVLLTITVAPTTASIAAGNTQQFTATGHYSDLSTQNLTTTATWSSSNTSAATVSNSSGSQGLATGVAAGATTITATSGAISGTAVLTVTSGVLLTITVAPTTASIAAGNTQQFTATGHYSDLSTQNLTTNVTWSSSNTSAATVSNSSGSRGLATGVASGASSITATSGAISGTAVLTVTPAVLVSISVAPTAASIVTGGSQFFTATAHYSDHTTQNVTTTAMWSSSNTSAATVSNTSGSQGLATGVGPGSSQITATDFLTGIRGSASLTVSAPKMLTITPSSGPPNTAVQIRGTGFPAGAKIKIFYVNGHKRHRLYVASVSSDGSFLGNAAIPSHARAGALGQHTILATGRHRLRVTTTFTLTS